MPKIFFIILLTLVLGLAGLAMVRLFTPEDTWLCQNNQWVKHGNPKTEPPSKIGCEPELSVIEYQAVTETAPETAPYLQEINSKKDLVQLTFPAPFAYVSSPVNISGFARGNWFFEGSFPVFLVDWDGLIIAQGVATAQTNWLTEDFVPFKSTLEFIKPAYKNNGSLILKKDNPSGLPQNDNALEIPIFYQ